MGCVLACLVLQTLVAARVVLLLQHRTCWNSWLKFMQLFFCVDTFCLLFLEKCLCNCFVFHWTLAMGPARFAKTLLRVGNWEIAFNLLWLNCGWTHFLAWMEFTSRASNWEVRSFHYSLVLFDTWPRVDVDAVVFCVEEKGVGGFGRPHCNKIVNRCGIFTYCALWRRTWHFERMKQSVRAGLCQWRGH